MDVQVRVISQNPPGGRCGLYAAYAALVDPHLGAASEVVFSHSAGEVRALFADLPVRRLRLRTAISLPSGRLAARLLEQALPARLPWGGLLLVTGEKA
jgi:hypothetical protein